MKVLAALLLASFFGLKTHAQKLLPQLKNAEGITVIYTATEKGKTLPDETYVYVRGLRESIKRVPSVHKKIKETSPFPHEYTYVDFDGQKTYQMAVMASGDTVYSAAPFEFDKGFRVVGDTTLLGIRCRVARTSVNSNTVEVWYADGLPFKATPWPRYGVPSGVVLKAVFNGDRALVARKIIAEKKMADVFPPSWGKLMDGAEYRYALNRCNVIEIPIFGEQKVAFTGAKMPDTLLPDTVYVVGGGTLLLKKVRLPEKADGYGVFLDVAQYSAGDAYDRTGSVFVVPTDKAQSFLDAVRNLKSVPAFSTADGKNWPALISTSAYDAPLELMRFFTPFGIRQFNHIKVPGQTWADSAFYKMDVTALASRLHGEVWMGAYIGNWDGGGHRLSARLTYYPEGEQTHFAHAVPLFNTVNYLEQAGQDYPTFWGADTLRVTFTLAEDAPDARLFYLTTGHGGWGGGDEFNPKVNTIYVDGRQVFAFIPWRDDCGTSRRLNPCSGNFSNGLSSSDLSRSNWCPGTATSPQYIPLGTLKAGTHTLAVQIPQGAPEGGSFSYWCVSGTLLY